MLDRMPYNELLDWAEYDATVEPIGDRRADIRAALICSTFANANRDKKKKKEPFGITDFMLFEGKNEKGKATQAQGRITPQVITGLMVLADRTRKGLIK